MNLVIGLGTGACGTVSLSHLLNQQENAHITHECPLNMAWEFDPVRINNKLKVWNTQKYNWVGDVASYHLPYVSFINSKVDNVKFVCLKRDKIDTIKSLISKSKKNILGIPVNFKIQDGTFDTLPFYISFPKYKYDTLPEACNLYWEDYYKQAEELEQELENFKIFSTQNLNSLEGVTEILTFIGFKDPKLITGIVKNRS